ncbi:MULTISPECIES: hypothetical protein [Pyrobaculum]|uniref:Uncharacterized protein n=2 Tax=Pyrobaculum arsenaticum TaxID=121277 RepID=A4WHF3_PYRAR|nr:hypothetical protein [Pyrobaculum arsenaticum]ABP49820.1 conserved hypothetical protein [Pyrobaculum arsenaticum DSM 13514]NYR15806.1 hypothetical protein [Pyrobaculum arsenaticum]
MYRVYDRRVEIPIRISKGADEQARLRKLERWPREAGMTVVLDESGSNFSKLVQIYAADYGLELGEKKWDVKTEGDTIRAKLEIPLLKGGEVKGVAVMDVQIPKTPGGEEGNNVVYTADVQYYIEIDEQVLAESTTSGVVEFTL